MKKSTLLLGILLMMCLIYPILVIIGESCGFDVIVRNWAAHSIVFTGIFAGLSSWLLNAKEEKTGKLGMTFAILLLPSAVLHMFFWVLLGQFWLSGLLGLVWVGLAISLMLIFTRGWVMKMAIGILAGPMLLITLVVFLALLFPLGQNTVIQSVESPNGTYRAELIDSDQGALGGDTLVEVFYLNEEVDTAIFLFRRTPNYVYRGDWGEFENMKISWKSEQELLINGKVYFVE